MEKKYATGLMWFRRDLRAFDNAALYHALRACRQLHCVFILDTDILDTLPRAARRVEFILAALASSSVGALHNGTVVPMCAVLALCAVATALMARWTHRSAPA